jgi:tight adherence protein C
MNTLTPVLIVVLAFGAVVVIAYVIGQLVVTNAKVQHRIAAPAGGAHAGGSNNLSTTVEALVTTYFDEKRFGIQGEIRNKLRRELVKAGFFRAEAIKYYIFARLAVVSVLPTGAYVLTENYLASHHWLVRMGLVAIVMVLGVLGPDAYLGMRQRKLRDKYRVAFPDMLDLMVVCVDAGLSLDAAFERISKEIMRQCRELGVNLLLMGAETRAGRSSIDALTSLAERIGLDEARSFVAMLRQSVELGTDVADALRVFSDEMRDRRMLRAEERANKLPVKMVAPLGLCIFPVILMVALVPTAIRLMEAFK